MLTETWLTGNELEITPSGCRFNSGFAIEYVCCYTVITLQTRVATVCGERGMSQVSRLGVQTAVLGPRWPLRHISPSDHVEIHGSLSGPGAPPSPHLKGIRENVTWNHRP